MTVLLPFGAALMLVQSALTEAPRAPDPYLYCGCSAEKLTWDGEFSGIVTDAELRLAPDGRSPLPRQATIFNVLRSDLAAIGDTVKVWHVTDPQSCGVTFSYGRRARVRVRAVEDGWETDWCIDPRRPEPQTPAETSDNPEADD